MVMNADSMKSKSTVKSKFMPFVRTNITFHNTVERRY